jgi:uncharacterized protein
MMPGPISRNALVKRFDWTRGELAEGLRCYRSGKFFEAHEHWEAVWLELQDPEKTFLQGLIQVAAAFHHFQRGNQIGTVSLLHAALRRLEPRSPSFAGVSVTPLCNEIREGLRALEEGEVVSQLIFPKIELSS